MNNVFYPKQINKTSIETSENQCFFIMPFSENYKNLYDTLKMYLDNNNYNCVRVDNNLQGSVPIINLILHGIAESQYIVVDISEVNANVFYELGITHTIKEAENVFIIKESSAQTPFDITHLQYIEYNKNNLKSLSEELIKRLKANQYKNSFKKAIYNKQLVNRDDLDDFITYCTKIFDKNYISIYTQLLNENNFVIDDADSKILNSILNYDKILNKELQKDKHNKYIPLLFNTFFEVLLPCYKIDEVSKYINEVLHYKEYSVLSDKLLLQYQTDLAIKFAKQSRLCEITLKWIIEYFQRSKSTKVDLNRYKLEAFLLQSQSEEVDEFLSNAVLSDNNYIREHISDIVGEKRLLLAENNLITQLKRESNIYTTASIVEALGKLQSNKSLPILFEWLNKNADNVINEKNFFLLKHFRNAIINIDPNKSKEDFDKKYYNVLKINNAI